MLYVVALNARGAAGASMLARGDVEGSLLRIGEHATCDLRLPGAGIATCDVWREHRRWRVRRPDGSVGDARDGASVVVGQWSLLLLIGEDGEDTPTGQLPRQRSRPRFESEGRNLGVLDTSAPVMLGGGNCCAVKIPWTGEAVSAVLRNDGRTTRCYPIAGTTATRNGKSLAGTVALADGDVIALADSPPVTFADDDEKLDRLLGVLRGETEQDLEVPPDVTVPQQGRLGIVVGTGTGAMLSTWEAAFGAGALLAALAQCAVTIARW